MEHTARLGPIIIIAGGSTSGGRGSKEEGRGRAEKGLEAERRGRGGIAVTTHKRKLRSPRGGTGKSAVPRIMALRQAG